MSTLQELRESVENENLSYGELLEIQSLFDTVPDSSLREDRENAMASDMLDEIEAFYGRT